MTATLFPHIYVPTFEIKVENSPLPLPIARQITSVSVSRSLDSDSDSFSMSVYDPKLQLIDKQRGLLTEGTRVEISLGYVGNVRRMIVGEIATLSANFADSNAITVNIQGFDLLHLLTRGTIYRSFQESDSEIASQLAKEMELLADTDPTASRTELRTQDNESNIAFLKQLAQENGYSLWVDENTLYFKRERPTPNTVTLEWGKTLMNFSPQLSTAGQVNEIEVRRWDAGQRETISETATLSETATNELSSTGQRQIQRGTGSRSKRSVTDTSISNSQQAQALAEAEMRQQTRSLIQGNGTAVGHPDIQVGTRLELRGVYRFNGAYIVNQVTHQVGEQGYQTTFQVEREL